MDNSSNPSVNGPIISGPPKEPLPLREYFQRYPSLPGFVKRIPNDPHPYSLSQDLYVHSVYNFTQIIVEELTQNKEHRICSTQRFFSIPTEYSGWFEVLSQDGLEIPGIKSVESLAKAFPKRCLVREAITAFRTRSGEPGFQAVVIERGCILSLVETRQVPGAGSTVQTLLVCCTERREEVCFDLNQKGHFLPVAGATDIMGVHDVRSLLAKFRMPVTVRLVSGKAPPNSTGIFRLMREIKDKAIFAMPIKGETELLRFSEKDTSSKFLPNPSRQFKSDDPVCLDIERHCSNLIRQYMGVFHPLSPSSISRTMGRSHKLSEGTIVLDRNSRSALNAARNFRQNSRITVDDPASSRIQGNSQVFEDEDRLMQEIEDIYAGVRGAPTVVYHTVPMVNGLPKHMQASRQMRSASRERVFQATNARSSQNTIRSISYTAGGLGTEYKPRPERAVQTSHSFNLRKDVKAGEYRGLLVKPSPAGADRRMGVSQNRDPIFRNIPMDQMLRASKRVYMPASPVSPANVKKMEDSLTDGMFVRHGKQRLTTTSGLAGMRRVEANNHRNTLMNDPMPVRGSRTPDIVLDTRNSINNSANNNPTVTNNSLNNSFSVTNSVTKKISNFNPNESLYEEIGQKRQTGIGQTDVARYRRKVDIDISALSCHNKTDVSHEVGSAVGVKFKPRTRPKSYAGATESGSWLPEDLNLTHVNIHPNLESSNPPAPPKRSDSVTDFKLSQAEKENSLMNEELQMADVTVGSPSRPEITPGRQTGYRVADKVSALSRSLLKTCRKVTSRAGRRGTLVVTAENNLSRSRSESEMNVIGTAITEPHRSDDVDERLERFQTNPQHYASSLIVY